MQEMKRGGHDGVAQLADTVTAVSSEASACEVVDPSMHGTSPSSTPLRVTMLTGGGDKPYAMGMASALAAQHICLDFIGSDEVDDPQLHETPLINFLNLRGNQRSDATVLRKVIRVVVYYWRLLYYAARAEPRIFHILWNGKLEFFDRTALMLYYKLLGKKIVLTAHNVNAGKRDANDSLLNRLTLKIQYRFADHIFVHTDKMRSELVAEFGVSANKVTVIPFGLNDTVPNTALTAGEARRLLGVRSTDKTMLFFGHITPYKGLECLIAAFAEALRTDGNYRLIIAGRVKDCPEYWRLVQDEISRQGVGERVIQRIEFIPDAETERYFKAADVLVLPYTHIFQSGVLVLAYSFGLPVIASDVGSLREDIVEGETGYIFRVQDPADMARAIREYFDSDLYQQPDLHRREIRDYATRRYSWATVGEITRDVYADLCKR
jgi:glycosyltransferase involved in cell wall biosynthesis